MNLLRVPIYRQIIRYYSPSVTTQHLKIPFLLSSREDFIESAKDNTLYHYLHSLIKQQRVQFIPDPIKVDKTIASDSTYDPWLCSPETLPLTISLRKQEDVSQVPRWRKLPTVGYRVGKKLLTLYRDSIQTTWRVWRRYERIDTKEVLRALELGTFPQKFPHLTRKKFGQDVIRVHEINRLPVFLICLILFEELTFILMYLRPQLGLYRCLGNGAFKKLSRKYARGSYTLPSPSSSSFEAYNTVYSMSKQEKLKLLQNLIINKQPHWKLKYWQWFNQDSKLSNEINKLLQYLIIDDWLILKRIIEHSLCKSTPIVIPYNELVNCILERQLYQPDEDLNSMVNDSQGRDILINRLLCYLSFKYDGIDIENGHMNFTNKWGVDNILLFNHTGTIIDNTTHTDLRGSLVTQKHLEYFQ